MPDKIKDTNPEIVIWTISIGIIAALLNLEHDDHKRGWYRRAVEAAWFVVVAGLTFLLTWNWAAGKYGELFGAGLIGLACFLQRPIRVLIFKTLNTLGTDPLGCLERLVNLWRRK